MFVLVMESSIRFKIIYYYLYNNIMCVRSIGFRGRPNTRRFITYIVCFSFFPAPAKTHIA